MTTSNGSAAGQPDRAVLARLVMRWTGWLLTALIIGVFAMWLLNRYDPVGIDAVVMSVKNGINQEELKALNAVIETQGRISAQSSKDMTQLLLTALLPLLGAWVGTVLAFYFSREGFESASKAQLDLVKQLPLMERLRQFRVADRMVPRSAMQVLGLSDSETKDPATVALSRLLDVLKQPKVSRLPILGRQEQFLYLIHNSLKDRFIAAKAIELAKETKPVDVTALTLQDLLKMTNDRGDFATYQTFGDLAREAVAFVCENKTLADAKEAMDRVPGCQDVFVTHTGTPGEPVVGWLTNVEFARAAETFA